MHARLLDCPPRGQFRRNLPPLNRRLSVALSALALSFAGFAASPALRADDPAAQVYITPAAAAAHPDFKLQGEYAKPGLGLQVVAYGDGEFSAVIYRGGLPGAGWDRSERQVVEESSDGIRELIETLEVQRVERSSPTLGLAPPQGAVVLFDGSQESLERHWKPGARRTEEGLLVQGATSLDVFQDHTLHLEFLTPFMPKARGQGRGNSGVYYQGRFETQVLDSFGLEGKMNEAGGIYSIRDPDLNMCLPPLVWQTYDGEFTAARYDAEGKLLSPARLTVRLNGVEIHRDVELPHTTTAAPVPASAESGPLYLQDHGNPVRFRNVWVLPRNADREARRPVVPGFERFHAAAGGDDAAGGRLLLGELACTKCHAPSKELAALINVKEPPILDEVGSRLHPEWMYRYLLDPHGVKPGATMPGMLESLPAEERQPAAQALTSFLMTTGTIRQASLEQAAAKRGETLFHQVGCVQCHAPQNNHKVASGSSAPLIDIGKKYSIPSLAAFLKQPHKSRPSGRMPAWSLEDKQLQDIAAYLVGDVLLRPRNPNLKVKVYHGRWENLPDFDKLTPVRTQDAAGLDVNVSGREDDFGLVFEGYLPIERNGTYTFHLGSDDGSRLLIDGIEILRNDGVHAHSVASASTKLEAGPRPIRIEYFERAGEQSLTLEYEMRTLTRQDVSHKLTMTPTGNPAAVQEPRDEADPLRFKYDPQLIDRGRELFASLGCASCHALQQGDQRIASPWKVKPLAECAPDRGCLNAEPSGTDLQYELSPRQVQTIQTALATPAQTVTTAPADVLHRTMVAFNCYACHDRGGIGGPTHDRQELFTTTIPEMGDEGRLPPSLNGVGDKLNDNFLREVLRNGATDRPYMRTQMPKFIDRSVTDLAKEFIAADRRTESPLADIDEPVHRIKSTGRHLVGDQGLACVKCHSFGPHRATGIQAINLLAMPRRLRDDWFVRYLINPNAYRPGTRMPTGYPEGKATIRDVYHGDPPQQITAIWRYLQDGNKAGIPDGMVAKMIELKPLEAPVIYRNFIDGLSPRGIAVGYPEGSHLAWDANRMSLALIWSGRFIDASRHWEGRGQGFQPPLGDHVLRFEEAVPLAVLPSGDAPWPTTDPHASGYRFRGYRLDERRRPTFQYTGPGFTVSDFPEPQRRDGKTSCFRRTLKLTPTGAGGTVYFRAASGSTIEPMPDGGWRIDNALTIRLQGGTPVVRESAGRKELIVPLPAGEQTLVQELEW